MTVKRMDNVGMVVDDIDDTVARLGKRGAKLVGKVVQHETMYRVCYLRGPEGILIGASLEDPLESKR